MFGHENGGFTVPLEHFLFNAKAERERETLRQTGRQTDRQRQTERERGGGGCTETDRE